MGFKPCSVGSEGPNLSQESLPHTITPAAAWSQYGSMLHVVYSKFWAYHQNLDSSDQATFSSLLWSSIGEPVWTVASVSYSSWQEGHLLWSSAAVPASSLDVLCVQRLSSADLGWKDLSYFCLSIISNQSVHFHLTSGTKKFLGTAAIFSFCFLFLGPFTVG